MEIIVIRFEGDRCGEDIVDALLTTEAAGLSRGRAELDKASTAMQQVDLVIVYKSGIRTGQLAEVHNQLEGYVWVGKIVGIQHNIAGVDDPSATTSLQLERVTDFFN